MRIPGMKRNDRRCYNDGRLTFAVLHDVLGLPYVEDQRRDDPHNIGSLVLGRDAWSRSSVEYRQDAIGEYLWVVTAWHATTQRAKPMNAKPGIAGTGGRYRSHRRACRAGKIFLPTLPRRLWPNSV